MEYNIRVIKTTSENEDFIKLVGVLDQSLWERYSELTSDYWGNNILEVNPNVMVLYLDNKAVACGCFKNKGKDTLEIKRMFVLPEFRGRGFAQSILQELELWGVESGFSFSVLETLDRQTEAIGMYRKCGYTVIDNYEPYLGLKNSICMRKQI
ncbi:MAG: GNAT family N-acetyltransferase [Flavobacterium sp.]|jgi:GNAT superfamily N-acetyltransferase